MVVPPLADIIEGKVEESRTTEKAKLAVNAAEDVWPPVSRKCAAAVVLPTKAIATRRPTVVIVTVDPAIAPLAVKVVLKASAGAARPQAEAVNVGAIGVALTPIKPLSTTEKIVVPSFLNAIAPELKPCMTMATVDVIEMSAASASRVPQRCSVEPKS